jgi:hypothetical protein
MYNNQPPVYNQYNQPMNQYNQQQPQAGFAYANTNANQPQFQNNQYAPINQGPVNVAAAPVAKQRRQKPVFKLPVDEDYEDAEEDEEKEEVTKTKPVAPKKASPPKVENKNKSKKKIKLLLLNLFS